MWAEFPGFVLLCGFLVAALVIFFSGLRMTDVADRLADRTGLGEAIVGGVLLGAATSLSGTIVSITAALDGRASLAFSNAVGGIAAQTVFLAVADMFYRRVNLEHAAADLANVVQGLILMVLLTIPLLAVTSPEATIWAIHPLSLVIPVIYVGGLLAGRSARDAPMWKPVRTSDTDEDRPDEEDADSAATSTARFAAIFAGMMLLMGASGWVIAKTSSELSTRMELSDTLVGVLATAVVTSLPELVTTVVAVRRGALQLAVGGIIGGNMFDMLFLVASDIAYRDGSLYHAVGMQDFFWIAVALLMTSVLLVGLILRQRQGPGRIGGESLLILLIYAGAILTQMIS